MADVVYLPKHVEPSPALVVELRWDRKPGAAIVRTLNRGYSEVLRDWGGPVLLVGIAYDNKSKVHSCRIVEVWARLARVASHGRSHILEMSLHSIICRPYRLLDVCRYQDEGH